MDIKKRYFTAIGEEMQLRGQRQGKSFLKNLRKNILLSIAAV